MITARDLTLSYGPTPALRGASLRLDPGTSTALMGASGSGKSSLLHCLAGVLVPDTGVVHLDGVELSGLGDRDRSRLRLERIGVVFQHGDLVPEMTVIENVALPLQLLGVKRAEARRRAQDLLAELGVADVAHRRTSTVSGGQAQRAAVARAVVHEPTVVLADEPTGALDSLNAEAVMDALVMLVRRAGATLLVVTHDNLVASHLDRLVTLSDGVVVASGQGAVR
ncbi:ABC transporter ATP-binding protein [Nocardioides jishulii]|uniref:ABC transporter ATP-binding protein n=1 Tax=Nocardioides jishulii TaxID=2575440 RepID=A0A4U2YT92_9ACTN|nr:ABC transporter ATP-binding protein [Nocardioides jishulii]QCX28879.1 ABC transporter ATP-binding protein [Nocardioides jishulii]TKI64224.1 ABC transporter ATP-binding protein [Nocardioides jishulii]